jgi:tetratricopeptide (TPR) repeat protein
VLTSGALLLVTRALTAERTSRVPWWLLAGAVFGVASLNRPNMAFGLAGIAVALLAVRRVRPLALVAAGALVAVVPVAVRNVAVSNQWSLTSSHGGLNFYIGNNAAATGFFNAVPGITPNIKGQAEDARQVAGRALGHPVSDDEASEYFSGLAWTWIRQHPVDALGLFARKLGYVFSAHHVALPHSYPFYAYDAGTVLRFLAIGPWLLIPLGVTGLVFFAPVARREDYWIWLAFVPAYAIGVAAFFVAERYRLPLLIPLSIGSGAAIDGVLRAWAGRRASTLAWLAAVFAALALFANRPLPLHDGRWEEGLRLAEHFVTIGRYDEAEQWAATLESDAPRRGLADYGVGVRLRAAKQDARAVPLLRRAHEAGIPPSGIELADALLKLGRLAMQAKAPEEGVGFFKEAVSIAPEQADARLQYGLSLLVLDRYDQAAIQLAEAARLDPRDAEAPAHLAYCDAKLGRLDDARAHADAALALDPNHVLARQLKAALAAR